MSEQTVGTLHAHNEHQAVCPHCDFANRELVRLQGELEEARREYEGPMAGEIQRLQGEKAALEAQDEVHWKTRRALLKEKEALERELAEAKEETGAVLRAHALSQDPEFVAALSDEAGRALLKTLDEAHAAIRALMSLTDRPITGSDNMRDYVQALRAVKSEHAPAIRRATGGT